MRAYVHARDWCRPSRERQAVLRIEDAREFADHARDSIASELSALARFIESLGTFSRSQGAAAREACLRIGRAEFF